MAFFTNQIKNGPSLFTGRFFFAGIFRVFLSISRGRYLGVRILTNPEGLHHG